MTPDAVWSLGTNLFPGDPSDSGQPYDPWLQQEPDFDCRRVKDPDMAFSSSPELDDSMAPDDSIGSQDQYDSIFSIALEQLYSHQW